MMERVTYPKAKLVLLLIFVIVQSMIQCLHHIRLNKVESFLRTITYHLQFMCLLRANQEALTRTATNLERVKNKDNFSSAKMERAHTYIHTK